jgi:hypothetical protein
LEIGKVVGSTDQIDYVVQVYGPGDVAAPPTPAQRAFGQFVSIPVDDANDLVGVVYSTQLFNPAYGTLGPRLSTEQELPVFSPDYLAETATIVGVAVVGWATQRRSTRTYFQGTPSLAAPLGAAATTLASEAVLDFHRPLGRVQLAYFPTLLARPSPPLVDLLCGILDRLIAAWPDERRRLNLIRQNLRWRSAIERR